MKYFSILLVACITISCNSESDPIADVEPELRAPVMAKDSVLERIKSLGGYTLIATEEYKKCNLVRGFYSLNIPIKDSLALATLAKHLAFELFKNKKPEVDCEYPIMSQVFIYPDSTSYKKYEGDYLVMANVTPKKLTGDAYVNTYKLKGYKSEKGE